jgi:ribonuclease III
MAFETPPTLREILPHEFQDETLLFEALTHKSHFNEKRLHNFNERLEFLGDAVLNLSISEMLMERLPVASEGLLSKVRSQIVNEAALAEVARAIQLGTHLNLGKGEEKGGGRNRDSLLADALEALLGALYLDAGIAKVKEFILINFPQFKEDASFHWEDRSLGLAKMDHKSRFQELCQQAMLGTPRYECVLEPGANPSEGPFTMILMIQDIEVERTVSRSKKTATQTLARKLLDMDEEDLFDLLRSKGLEPKRETEKA